LRLKIDTHIHTLNSSDSNIRIEDIFRRAREEKLDGFAIADHDYLTLVEDSRIGVEGLIVINGMEVSARGAHVLALDISEPVPPGLSISETVDRIKSLNGVAVLAHPYSVFRTWVKQNEVDKAGFEAIEVINAYQFPYNMMLKMNRRLSERLGLPQTGGSDAHIPRVIGRAFTVFESESRDVEGVIEALKKGETEAYGSGVTMSERIKLYRK
jgi:predicted metal-dependent phosphoesterase TrpH